MNENKILNLVNDFPDITQRKLAEKLKLSLGKINTEIKKLETNGIIIKNNGYYLSIKGKEKLKKLQENKVVNAVILAAGKAKDFEFPNGFVEIENEVIIERSIKILLEMGIKKIYMVIGYRQEYYKSLSERYNEIILVENNNYERSSSYYSLCLMKNYLKDNFLLLDSDIVYEKKALKKILNSKEENLILISSETGSKDECYVEAENDIVVKISKDKSELKKINGEMLGISKLSYNYFKKIIELKVENLEYSYEYSIADVAKQEILKVLKINDLVWGEVDNKEQYDKILKEIYPKIKRNELAEKTQELKRLLISILNIELVDIDEIEVLGGMTNKNYLITINNKKYVLRIAGAGTENIINRYSEKINAKEASKIGVDKELIYFDEKSGVKISEYIEEAETLNPETSKKIENLLLTSKLLRKLHTSGAQFENRFDVFDEIIKYENLIKNKDVMYKKYHDYLENKKQIFNLEEFLKKNGKIDAACHNDTVPENFIKNDKNEMFLIDWEYSGMNDPMWDLAAHSLEANFSIEEEKMFLEHYFEKNIKKEDVLRIECYKILQDFLWSIWTVLKEENGDDFGTYGIDRYNRGILRLKEIIKNEI
ncbi:winged helix-turn-helix transcriptional regulator [Cetobacterium sp.]|uniref:winged helix-turn-helix transcriptional regulator n=1 Tax=Cetobacterium sp. TaxID=2071632 RepID=UPI003EE58D6B